MTTVSLPKPELTDGSYFDLADALARLEEGRPLAFPPFEMVYFPDEKLSFALNMERDPIQNALRKGEFFEREELDAISQLVKPGAQILDIGANIGNHAVYFATKMQASRVVVVEPNPLALAPLVANIVLNKLTHVIDMSALGVGLSDASQSGFGMKRHDRNLGATKMFEGRGHLTVHAGDDLFEGETPDFIKIDVEGMEMKVLSGLKRTIENNRPVILIEVDGENDAAFVAWCGVHCYEVQSTIRHSRKNCNYLITPKAN